MSKKASNPPPFDAVAAFRSRLLNGERPAPGIAPPPPPPPPPKRAPDQHVYIHDSGAQETQSQAPDTESEFEKVWAGMPEVQVKAMEPVFKALVKAGWDKGRKNLRIEAMAYISNNRDMPGEVWSDLQTFFQESRKRDARG